jgi:hypothetical protein
MQGLARVYSTLVEIVFSQKIDDKIDSINIESLKRGIYFLVIDRETAILRKKMIKS